MGVFSFIKDAGGKIFGKEKEQEEENIEIPSELPITSTIFSRTACESARP